MAEPNKTALSKTKSKSKITAETFVDHFTGPYIVSQVRDVSLSEATRRAATMQSVSLRTKMKANLIGRRATFLPSNEIYLREISFFYQADPSFHGKTAVDFHILPDMEVFHDFDKGDVISLGFHRDKIIFVYNQDTNTLNPVFDYELNTWSHLRSFFPQRFGNKVTHKARADIAAMRKQGRFSEHGSNPRARHWNDEPIYIYYRSWPVFKGCLRSLWRAFQFLFLTVILLALIAVVAYQLLFVKH